MKCITDLIIASFATGHPISNESVSKLSTNEVQLMKRLQALVEHYGGMMITLCTGKFPFDRLQTTVEVSYPLSSDPQSFAFDLKRRMRTCVECSTMTKLLAYGE